MTIDDVAILLGMSDHTACKLEHSALGKLRAFAGRVGLTPSGGLDAIPPVRGDGPIDDAPTSGDWQRLSAERAVAKARGSVIDLPLAFTFLRRSLGRLAISPVYFASPDQPFRPAGEADAVVRVGSEVYFRAPGLRGMVGTGALRSEAVVDYVHGRDEEGAYSVPVLLAIVVRRGERRL